MSLVPLELKFDEPSTVEVDEKDKEKKKNSLWSRAFNLNKLKKPNKVAVIYLRNNGRAQTMELEPKEGFFTINGKTYHEDRDCIHALGKSRIPLAIIREWSLLPIGTKVWDDKKPLEKFTQLEEHVLKGIRHAELVRSNERDGPKLNAKAIVGFGILAVIIIAVVMGMS